MRIVFLHNNINQVGGVESVVCNLSSFFAEEYGWEVEIHSIYSLERNIYFAISPKVKIVHYGVDWRTETRRSTLKRVGDIISALGTCILIPCLGSLAVGTIINRKKFAVDGKIVYLEHNSVLGDTKKRRALNSIFFRFLDYLIVLTTQDRTYYQRLGFKNCTKIPNAISLQCAQRSALDNKTMISVGRLEEVKGYDMLLDAFAEVHQKYPDWKLRILGDGSCRQALEQQSERLGLQNSVEFPGFVKDVEGELRQASVFLMSSRSEGFSLVTVEAMECGLPVVAFDLPAMKDILIAGSGIRVPCNDADALAEGMITLIEQEGLRKEMGAAAKRRAADYRTDAICQQWKELFESLEG